MSDYNKEATTPDSVKIKIENLQKNCMDYSDQKRQKIDDADDSTSYNTVDLYGDNEYVQKSPEKVSLPIIEEPNEALTEDPPEDKSLEDNMQQGNETTQEIGDAANLSPATAEDEFIPIGAHGKVHWIFF